MCQKEIAVYNNSDCISCVKLNEIKAIEPLMEVIERETRHQGGFVERAKMEKFKTLLLQAKIKIINGGILRSSEDLTVSSDDLSDEADLASSVINQQVSFNMRQREIGKLKAIEDALYRIEQGSYGHCEECEESIGQKRLENQSWTTLCITHAEEQEREKQKFSRAN